MNDEAEFHCIIWPTTDENPTPAEWSEQLSACSMWEASATLALLKNVRDFIENWTFNVPSESSHASILNALDGAIIVAEKSIQISDSAKSRREEIMRLMREDFDPTPDGWEGRDWNDNAEDVADRIESLYRSQTTTAPEGAKTLADWSNLPKDIYVIEATSLENGIAFDVTCCSVPMVTAPEVRYTRAEVIADLERQMHDYQARVVALEAALLEIAESGAGYTTGDGHAQCKEIARTAISNRRA
jgi:hypothetical protein